MATRTHTHFWSEDDLVPLLEEAARLRTDFESRSNFIPTDLKQAARDRIDNLDIAIRLLGDRAD